MTDQATINQNDGTMEAFRLGLNAMRAERDALDQKIRACERALNAPTKASPTLERTVKKSRGYRRPDNRARGALTYNNVRSSLYSNSSRKMFVRGEVVRHLIESTASGELIAMQDLSRRLNFVDGAVSYAIRTAPRGLFRTERNGTSIRVALTDTGREMSTKALADLQSAHTHAAA